MIENTVHNHADPIFMCQSDKFFEIFIIPKSSVYFFVIFCIITMCRRFKQRSDIDRCNSDLL